MTDLAALAKRAVGRWTAILPLLGLDRQFLSGKHGPCPFCGGTDRFRFDNKDGTGSYYCNQCGAGSGMGLAHKLINAGDWRTTAQRVEALIGSVEAEKPKAKRDDKSARRNMIRLWDRSRPIREGDAAWLYFRKRGIRMSAGFPPVLRLSPPIPYNSGDDRLFPALLAKVVGSAGDRAVNVHRTYLTPAGDKAPVDPVRKMMPGQIPAGSAVRLGRIGRILGLAEGVETALSAKILFGVPVWSAINADRLERFVIPRGVEELVIFGDNDLNFAGQLAAYRLANRAVIHDKIQTRVEIPADPGQDWNDVLLETVTRVTA